MRIQFLDIIRAISFILMFIFHIFVAINLFKNDYYNLNESILYYIGFISRNIFILLFGISLYLSYINSNNIIDYKKKQFHRINMLLICSIIITITTYIFIPNKYIVFGILHFFSISTIILYNFVNNIPVLLIILLFILFYNNYIPISYSKKTYPIAMFIPYYKSTIDHFHIFKYLPVLIIGILLGHLIHHINKKHNLSKYQFKNKILEFIGKNTLLLYMIHIPILYILVGLFSN